MYLSTPGVHKVATLEDGSIFKDWSRKIWISNLTSKSVKVVVVYMSWKELLAAKVKAGANATGGNLELDLQWADREGLSSSQQLPAAHKDLPVSLRNVSTVYVWASYADGTYICKNWEVPRGHRLVLTP